MRKSSATNITTAPTATPFSSARVRVGTGTRIFLLSAAAEDSARVGILHLAGSNTFSHIFVSSSLCSPCLEPILKKLRLAENGLHAHSRRTDNMQGRRFQQYLWRQVRS